MEFRRGWDSSDNCGVVEHRGRARLPKTRHPDRALEAHVATGSGRPYRFTRNPIYLSFAITYVGLAFVFNSLPALILLVPLIVGFDRTQILREERYLEGEFGEEYLRYKERVRRWI